MLDFHDETVKFIFRDNLNISNMNFESVRQTRDIAQKAARVEMSRGMRDLLEGNTDRSSCNMYPGDEMCMYIDNAQTSMWIGADCARFRRARLTVASKKPMF
jgi:hypothetical protein